MLASRFVEALKKCLRARGMTYAALARELRISEASVKRMFSRSSFTLLRIEEILAALDLDLHEVARMSLASAAGPAELTLDQENGAGQGRAPDFGVLAGAQRLALRADCRSFLDLARRADPDLCALGPAQDHRMGQRREGAAANTQRLPVAGGRAGEEGLRSPRHRRIPRGALRFAARAAALRDAPAVPRVGSGAQAAPGEAGGRVQ